MKKKKNKLSLNSLTNQISWWLSVTIIGVFLGMFLQLVQAWVDPSAPPPKDNLGAPINTGYNVQKKKGALYLNVGNGATYKDKGLLVLNGNVGIGTTKPSEKLDVQGNIKASGTVCDSNGCIGGGDGYIGNSGTHNAGGNLDMKKNKIKNVSTIGVSSITSGYAGEVDFRDQVNMNGNKIKNAKGVLDECRFKTKWGKSVSCKSSEFMIHGACSVNHGAVENFTSRRAMSCIENTGGGKVEAEITAICCGKDFQ